MSAFPPPRRQFLRSKSPLQRDFLVEALNPLRDLCPVVPMVVNLATRAERLNNMGTDEPFRARDKKFHVFHLRKEFLPAVTVRARNFRPQWDSRVLFGEVAPEKHGSRSGATSM